MVLKVLPGTSASIARSSAHQDIPSCAQSPMQCTEPESLGEDHTESKSFRAPADGREEE